MARFFCFIEQTANEFFSQTPDKTALGEVWLHELPVNQI